MFIGVMTNVVMLNFSYDVPVKLYSSHLLCMAFVILLPDIPRLVNLLIFNRNAKKADLRPAYAKNQLIWVQRTVKSWLVFDCIRMANLSTRFQKSFDDNIPDAPAYFGAYNVVDFSRNGKTLAESTQDETRWTRVTFRRFPFKLSDEKEYTDFLSIRFVGGTGMGARPDISADGMEINILGNDFEPVVEDGKLIQLAGTMNGQAIIVKLKPISREDFLLVNRGFRWINEYPFNR